MKKKIIFIILFVVGLCLVLYPALNSIIVNLRQNQISQEYDRLVSELDREQLDEQKKAAEEYNKSIVGGVINDPFLTDSSTSTTAQSVDDDVNRGYYNALTIGQEAMAYLSVPVIDLRVPIYHGTSERELQAGVGHLMNTSLPVGGESTHCVLTGHTGVAGKELFTNIDKLKCGDRFYIHVLDDTLAYQVDDISVVLPGETDKLKIAKGEDYVTLITCTPYGINSHRLFVRGTRVEYTDADRLSEEDPKSVTRSTEPQSTYNIPIATYDEFDFSRPVTMFGYTMQLWLWCFTYGVFGSVVIFIVSYSIISRVKVKRKNGSKQREVGKTER